MSSASSGGGGEHTPTPWHFDELVGGRPDGCGYIRCETDNLEISHHGDMGRSREINLANAALIVEAVNSHATLKARIEELENPFRAVDDKDWAHLDQFIPQSGHGRFWREVFAELRATLASKGGVK